MVESAEQVDVEVEGSDELVTEVGVQADRHLVHDAGNDHQGTVQQHQNVVVVLLLTILLHLDPHRVVQPHHLLGQVVEEDEGTFERLHLHSVLAVHLTFEPLHELAHLDVYHSRTQYQCNNYR